MKDLFRALGELIFPRFCPSCGDRLEENDRRPLCFDCLGKIRPVASPLCLLCGIPFAASGSDHLCGDCILDTPPFLLARAWGHYETLLSEAIHQFKYGGKTLWGSIFGTLMAEAKYPGLTFSEYSLLVPVPLHKKRLRLRGFNQSAILAAHLARRNRLPIDFMNLIRHVNTPEQTKLGRDMREANLKGAFSIRDKGRFKGEKIIVVDDVYTTGSTVKECCRTLLEGQAGEVSVLTLARVG